MCDRNAQTGSHVIRMRIALYEDVARHRDNKCQRRDNKRRAPVSTQLMPRLVMRYSLCAINLGKKRLTNAFAARLFSGQNEGAVSYR